MHKTWFAVVLVGSIAVVVFVLVLVRRDGVRESGALGPAGGVEERATARAQPLAANELEPAGAVDREALTVAPTEVREKAHAEAPSAPATATRRVEGTVVLVDEHGVEHPRLDGRLELTLWMLNSGESRAVAVQAGQWSADVEHGVELDVKQMELDGRAAVLEGDRSRRFPTDAGLVELRARRLLRTVLHVVDAGTRAPLRGLTLLRIDHLFRGDMEHPGESLRELLREGASSPLEIEPNPGRTSPSATTFLVRATGYAWGRIQLDLALGGERELALEQEGRLDVVLLGDASQRGAQLHLRRADRDDRQPYTELEVRGRERFELEGLRPGEYLVAVEVGDWWDAPLVRAEASAVVDAGGRTELSLLLAAPPELVRAPLSGVLVVPEAWGLSELDLEIELRDTPLAGGSGRWSVSAHSMKPVPGEREARAWSSRRDVQVGRYKIGTRNPEYSIVVDVPPSGCQDVRFELPPPAMVSVELVDDETGQPADIDSIFWSCRRPEGVNGGGVEPVARDPENGRFVFRAPQCTLELRHWGGVYQPLEESLEVGPGTNAVTFRMQRAATITFRLMDGDTPVPWEESVFPPMQHLDGEGKALLSSVASGALTLSLSDPGRYRFELPRFPGFEPLAPIEVVARKGEDVERVVELVRER